MGYNGLIQKPLFHWYNSHFFDFSNRLYYLIVAKNFLIALPGMFSYLLTHQYRKIGNNISKNFIPLAVVICLFSLGMIIPVAELVYQEIKVFQEIQFSRRFFAVIQAIIPHLFAESIGMILDDKNIKKFSSLPCWQPPYP